ncbi:MAG: isoleucine--tRNA ligase [Bacteroidota bacterium]
MKKEFAEYKQLDLPKINKEILDYWREHKTFEKSISIRNGAPDFVFYEGPPSANGKPGIHHVIARTIKDIYCRYKTMKGFRVERKAGWDTHGLPVELGVEKALGITKDDIGKTISIEDYNKRCREDVMKYTDIWVELTDKMGYWIDMDNPYITYDNRYIETVWYLLKELYKKGLLYKDYTIQPYSPGAGTGLSTHELNQPGCYRDVKDTTVVAQFKAIHNTQSDFLFKNTDFPGADECSGVFFLAWTTTPWTLPSNTALAIGEDITYISVKSYNQYTGAPIKVILAKELLYKFFNKKNEALTLEEYKPGDKKIPFEIAEEFTGKELAGIRYEQLLPYHQPTDGDAFKVLLGDFVSTEEGTGIVHLAPSFGADDFRVSRKHGIGSLTLVDKNGKFVEGMEEFSGRYVKNEFDPAYSEDKDPVDVDIAMKLKKENKAFKIEKYIHTYPHCWRTDKPVLYYPLDSWFIKTTAVKDRLIELNQSIHWKPESTGTGRFGKWLENLMDWNLSRSRYWGTPLPIWSSEDGKEHKCIGSVKELNEEIIKSIQAGIMKENPLADFEAGNNSESNYLQFDLHRPYVDRIVLVSESGQPMHRELDLIDVWFDSGAMPYAQLHYPFENKEQFEHRFPADFIAEGVDQTRGWFFTLHAIAVMLFDNVAYKNIVSNGLVLDKEGVKMTKRLGNVIDPFDTIEKHGSDTVRWYMMTNAQPWDNIKFNMDGLQELQRKFFGTLYNTYSFFALYANVDGFRFEEKEIPVSERPEIDRWIISLLHSLTKEVTEYYDDYEATRAGRSIQYFVTENLSNWYVRLNRKRFWGGGYNNDKKAAYQTLYTCLETIALLAAPIAPFYSEKIFFDLNNSTGRLKTESIHLADFPVYDEKLINKDLEKQMEIAQKIASMVLSLRRKVNLKVRQPLNKILIPVLDEDFKNKIEAVKPLILNEVNIKNIEYVFDTTGIITKKIKANFKQLGPKYGKLVKHISAALNQFSQEDITALEKNGKYSMEIEGKQVEITTDEVEIISEDIPGWLVTNDANLTIALDINVTEDLKYEGIARELVNRIQNIRKDNQFDVTDKIEIEIQQQPEIEQAVKKHMTYISSQTLSDSIKLVDVLKENNTNFVQLDDNIQTNIKVKKV